MNGMEWPEGFVPERSERFSSRAVMSEIPTRHYRHRQDLHALDRRQPSFLPGVGHDYEGTSMRYFWAECCSRPLFVARHSTETYAACQSPPPTPASPGQTTASLGYWRAAYWRSETRPGRRCLAPSSGAPPDPLTARASPDRPCRP